MNEYENMTKEELLTRCLFLDEVVAERNEQIEKMKCCGNCKHFSFPLNVCYYAHEHQVWKTFEDTIPCGKWELADS